MPMRQIRKNPKQRSHKSRSRKQMSKMHNQKGGDPGRYNLPQAYFGKGIQGYYADGSSELNSCGKQHAVSQGIISANGKWAGPNLYPMMGGACGCSGRRYLNQRTMKGGNPVKKTKSRKFSKSSKSRLSKKH
jgi:hypothetical protein